MVNTSSRGFSTLIWKQEHHPEFLLRAYLRYEILEAALEYAVTVLKKVRDLGIYVISPACLMVRYSLQDDARLAREQPRSAASTWLPYTLIDQVLLAAESQEDLTLRGKGVLQDLRAAISNRMRHVENLTGQRKQPAQ